MVLEFLGFQFGLAQLVILPFQFHLEVALLFSKLLDLRLVVLLLLAVALQFLLRFAPDVRDLTLEPHDLLLFFADGLLGSLEVALQLFGGA